MGIKQQKTYHLDLDSLARNLKLTSIDVIKTTNMDIESHWFRSIGPVDLYYWKAQDKIVKHQLSLFDQVIEWNEYDGVKTGYFADEREEDKSQIICFDEDINSQVILQAVDFLNRVETIDRKLIDQFISNYRFYNRWKSGDLARPFRQFFRRIIKKS